jgi:hypothetical protein
VRLRALEESFRKEEIDQETYDRVRLEVAGGDLSSTHLVKGLDLKLLKRVREGEDVFSAAGPASTEPGVGDQEPEEEPEDVDDKFEALERAEVQAIAKEKEQKHGQYATTAVPGQKRSRNQILAELRAAREAAKAKEVSALGSRFKKIGQRQKPGTRIERDSKGREVMIIVDEDGHERRKVRQVNPKLAKDEIDRAAFVPDKDAEVLGMEVPDFYKQQQAVKQDEEEDDGNIFGDAGSDYDPLAGLEGGSDSDESREDGKVAKSLSAATSDDGHGQGKLAIGSMPPPPKPAAAAPRNYFQDSKTALISAEMHRSASLADPAVLAALRNARALNAASKSEEEEKEAERQARLKKMLHDSSRDDADLDMGFGMNRLEDEEDQDDSGKVRLSKWGGEDGGEGAGGGGKVKRKRGPKKKKGDVNSAADVLQAMARRKGDAP